MNPDSTKQLNELREIRSLMEKSSSFLSLSGLSGIAAGITGLIAGIILQITAGSYFEEYEILTTNGNRDELILTSAIILTVTLIIAISLAYYFSRRKAIRKGQQVKDASAKNLAVNLMIPLVTGGVFSLIMLLQKLDHLVFPAMLIFFGLALVNGSKYTLNEIKWLGLSEIILGLIAIIIPEYSIIFWTTGFGLLNIIYGTAMYYRHDRNEKNN